MPQTIREDKNAMQEYKVTITETVVRPVWVAADDPLDALRIAEENYINADVLTVSYEVDPASRRHPWERMVDPTVEIEQ
jgi:hypothetical protein